MRLLLFLCINLLIIKIIKSASEADCYLNGVEESHWLTGYHNEPIDDFEEHEFKRFKIENIENIELFGDHYGKYFDVNIQDNNLLIISPTKKFKDFETNENGTNDPKMFVTFKFKCKTGVRQLLFYQPIRDSNTYPPEFSNPPFTYHLPMPLPAGFVIDNFGPEIVACDMDISNVRVHFTNIVAEDFLIYWKSAISGSNKCHKAVVTTLNPLRLLHKKVYEIVVTDMGIPSRNTSTYLTVEVNEKNSLPLGPQFEQAYYIGAYQYSEDGNHSLHFDNPIHLKEGCSNVKLQVLEYDDIFKVNCDSNEVFVELIGKLNSEDFRKNNRAVIIVTIEATIADLQDADKTILEIYTEEDGSDVDNCIKECPPCQTAIIPLKCATTPRPPAPASFINFRKDHYQFERRYGYVGFVGAVSSVISPEEDIEYSIVPTSDSNISPDTVECDKKTGVLKINSDTLYTGIYTFKIYAKGVKSKVETEASVDIRISMSESAINSVLSMLVVHVTEEMETVIRLPCPYLSCNYSILEQHPKTNHSISIHRYSNINVATRIDRESMAVPQISLSLNVAMLQFTRRKRNTEDFHDREWLRVAPETLHIMEGLLVLLIIDDINDNAPVFEVDKKLIIGYPDKTLNAVPPPPYLVQVSATDLDVEENATIRYSTKSTNFVVNPTTGIIYTNNHAFGNATTVTFYVTATDRNGTEDGLSTNLEIEVKFLKEEHLLNITVNNITLEDVDYFIANLSNNTENMTIKYLTSLIIPICYCNNSIESQENSSLNISMEDRSVKFPFLKELEDISTESENTSSMPTIEEGAACLNYSIRLFIYALDDEDELVEVSELKRTLQKYELWEKTGMHHEYQLRTLSVDYEYDYKKEEEADLSRCILMDAILLSLLICFIVVGGVFYYFKVYKQNEKRGL